MSSDRRSDAPSPPPDELAALVRTRGAPLVEGLARHLPGAEEHGEATASYAFVAAAELGFPRDHCELYREATRLHEIGLVYVPVEVAEKPARARTPEETAAFDGHYEAGYRLARGAGIPERVCGWILRQRERFDGRGPEGLAGEQIPVESRLMRAACACQTALAADASGGDRSPLVRARAALLAASGKELDPRVAEALTSILSRARQG